MVVHFMVVSLGWLPSPGMYSDAIFCRWLVCCPAASTAGYCLVMPASLVAEREAVQRRGRRRLTFERR